MATPMGSPTLQPSGLTPFTSPLKSIGQMQEDGSPFKLHRRHEPSPGLFGSLEQQAPGGTRDAAPGFAFNSAEFPGPGYDAGMSQEGMPNMDGLFNGSQLTLRPIGGESGLGVTGMLPGINSIQMVNSSSHMAKMRGASARNCCLLFGQDIIPRDSDETIKTAIREIVERMKKAKHLQSATSVSLRKNPSYFLDKHGKGVWVVFNSVSTPQERWRVVGAALGALECFVVYRAEGVSSKSRGFFHVGSLFGMTEAETAQLFNNVVECDELPQGTPRQKRTSQQSDDADPSPKSRARTGGMAAEKDADSGGAASGASKRYVLSGRAGKGAAAVSALVVEEEVVVSGGAGGDVITYAEGLPKISITFIRTPGVTDRVFDFVKSLKEASAQSVNKYSLVLIDGFPGTLLKTVLRLQDFIAMKLRTEHSVPVKTLTLDGVVKHNEAWNQLRTNLPRDRYDELVKALNDIIGGLDESFTNLTFVLLDPVSCIFYLSVHILYSVRNKSDRNPPLFLSMCALTKDFRRFVHANYLMGQFIREFFTNIPVEIMDLLPAIGASEEQFWMKSVPPCLQSFPETQGGDTKGRRISRFSIMLNDVLKAHQLDKTDGSIEALKIFNLMQESTGYLRGLGTRDPLFCALAHANSHVKAMKDLYGIIRQSKATN